MAENKTEYFLRNINEKVKNRNKAAWKFWSGYLGALLLILIGGLFRGNLRGLDQPQPHGAGVLIGMIFVVAGGVWLLVNIILSLIALYRSTKDYK